MNNWIYKQLQKNGIYVEQDVLMYGLSVIKEQSLFLIVDLGICQFLHIVLQNILFLMFFIPVRKHLGGYHCKTRQNCFIVSVLSSVFMALCIKNVFVFKMLQFLFLILSMTILLKFGIIDHPNKRLSSREKQYHTKKLMVVFTVYLIIWQVGQLLNLKYVCMAIVLTVIFSFLNATLVKIIRIIC